MFNDKYYGCIRITLNGEFSDESLYLLKKNQERQKLLIEQRAACDFNQGYDANSETADSVSDLLIRAFNVECCSIMTQLKNENVHILGELIEKSFKQLNDLGCFGGFYISISFEYFNLKLDELIMYYNALNSDKKIDYLKDL